MTTAFIFAAVVAASAAIARWWDGRRLARDMALPLPARVVPSARPLMPHTAERYERLRNDLIARGNWNAYLVQQGQRRGLGLSDVPIGRYRGPQYLTRRPEPVYPGFILADSEEELRAEIERQWMNVRAGWAGHPIGDEAEE